MTPRQFAAVLLSLMGGLLVAGSPPAKAGPGYSDLYVFGDSLSDSGNVFLATGGTVPPPALGYVTGRFTNGANYADDLAARLGLGLGPSLAGGNNFAWGGARAGTLGGGGPTGVPALPGQVGAFVARPGPADPGALYVVLAGGNDIRAALVQAAIDPSLIPGMLNEALFNIGSAIVNLAQEGARNFLVPNLPDLSQVPALAGNPPAQAAALNLVGVFNTGLQGVLDGEPGGLNIARFDTFAFVHGLIANPPPGLVNVTDACLVGVVTCANPDSYLFWDDLHPTRVTYELIADGLMRVVPEPDAFLLLCLGSIGVMLRRRRRLA